MSGYSRSPLSIAEESFLLLCAGPRPLALSGAELATQMAPEPSATVSTPLVSSVLDLPVAARDGDGSAAADPRADAVTDPGRPGTGGSWWSGLVWVPDEQTGAPVVALDELRRWLRSPAASNEVKNAVWSRLLVRAHRDGPAWVIAAVGMALPRLVRLATELTDPGGHTRHELDAEILTGFLTALTGTDPGTPLIFLRLLRAAQRSAAAWLRHQRGHQPGDSQPGSLPPPAPHSHTDLVLARLARTGVISQWEADLICLTRLDRVPTTALAPDLGLTPAVLRMRRRRAERRIAAALAGEALDSDPNADPCYTAALANLTTPSPGPVTPAAQPTHPHTATTDPAARTRDGGDRSARKSRNRDGSRSDRGSAGPSYLRRALTPAPRSGARHAASAVRPAPASTPTSAATPTTGATAGAQAVTASTASAHGADTAPATKGGAASTHPGRGVTHSVAHQTKAA